jgi:LAS superfamily LD-carboxypeptidase LdcB
VWQNGRYVEQATLIEVVGNNNETEIVLKEHLDPYLELINEAARDGLQITLTSGFRSYPEQVVLYSLYTSNPKKYALAAEPGRSNHQNGTAFDLEVGGFDGNPVYNWLKTHGPEYRFIRTVNKEPWHWEYRPIEASELAASEKFKLPAVTV